MWVGGLGVTADRFAHRLAPRLSTVTAERAESSSESHVIRSPHVADFSRECGVHLGASH